MGASPRRKSIDLVQQGKISRVENHRPEKLHASNIKELNSPFAGLHDDVSRRDVVPVNPPSTNARDV